MIEKGYCQKDNSHIEIGQGCPHPKDYCKYRKSCIIHFMDLEKKKEQKGKDEHPSHQ